jgi:hypothetical protein
MTGPEHYKEAERLLTVPRTEVHDGIEYRVTHLEQTNIAEAQVHATLALAAATLDAAYGNMSVAADEAWSEVITHA